MNFWDMANSIDYTHVLLFGGSVLISGGFAQNNLMMLIIGLCFGILSFFKFRWV